MERSQLRTRGSDISSTKKTSTFIVLTGLLVAAALAAFVASGLEEADAVTPPSAVTEYDFGGPGPAGDLQYGGRIQPLSMNPFDATKAIGGAESGGLWRTTDGGLTWSRIDSFPQFRMEDTRHDPNDPNIIIATTRYDGRVVPQSGVWRSANNGATWAQASVDLTCTTTPNAWGIGMVAGADTHQKIFVATDCGIAYSNDSGATWTQTGPADRFFGVSAVRTGVDTALAYACRDDGRIYTTTISGAATPTWAQPSQLRFFGGDPGRCNLAISPFNNNVVFATNRNCPQAGPCNNSTFGMKLFESDDGGSTWTELLGPSPNNRPGFVQTHRALDGDPTHYDIYWANGFAMYRQHCNDDGNAATVDCPVAAESGAQCAAGNVVDDDGDQMVNEGCPRQGPNCPGGSSPCPEDNGATPSECKNAIDDDGDGFINDGCPVMERFDNGTHVDSVELAFDPTVPGGTGCPLLISNDGGIGRSTDCGATWTDSNAGLNALQIYNVTGTVRGPGATELDLYFGTQDNEWWYTTDNGGAWTKAFCCEGMQAQVDYRVPPGGLSDIRTVIVNCGPCGNQTTDRGFANLANFPNPPGGGWGIAGASATTMFGNQRYAQFGNDQGAIPNWQMYVMQPETGAQCDNATDDDFDTGFNNGGAGAVNDGCPADGAAESGAQCHNASDDDGDSKVNDGCSHIFSKESGAECNNAVDDDGDNVVNDGCPRSGANSESGAQCLNNTDDDAADTDGVVNDGCPEAGVWAPMGPTFTTPPDRAPIVASGPASGPTFYFGVNTDPGGTNVRQLRKIAGPLNSTATMSSANGTAPNNISDLLTVGRQFYFPNVFTADPNDPTKLWAADEGTSQMKFSTDGGLSWQVDSELTNLVTGNGEFTFRPWNVGIDPEDGNRILVGTELAGVIASVNGGENWFTLAGSENEMHIANSFFFDNDHDLIYASTWGRGLWTIELPEADLSITKTDSPDPVMAGQELFYTLTVTNNGPSVATVEVVDTLPQEVTYIGTDLAPPLGCTEGPPNELRCELGVLDVSESISFVVKVRVKSNAAAGTPSGSLSIVNTATVLSTDTTDPDDSDNTATAVTFAEELADLKTTKICKPDTELLAGETATCTIFVDNLGPSDARNVHLTDTNLSDGSFSITGVTPSQGTCDPPADGVVTCDLGDLEAASPSVPGRATVTIDITATEAMDINDVATVVSDTPDPDLANNQAQDSVSVTAVSDLSLVKTDIPDPVVAGTNLTYTLTATNNGPSTASNVIVRDVLNSNVSIVSVNATGGASCNAGTPGDPFLPTTCAFDSMAPSASETMTIVVTVNSDVLGVIHNDARVSSDTFDDDNSNDFASEDTTVVAEADLEITKADLPDPVIAGTTLTYELTVVNHGPSDAVGVVVEDALPPEVTFQSATISNGSGTCVLFNEPPNTVSCQLDTVPPNVGSPILIYIDVLVNPDVPDGSIISNSATVSSSTPDPDGTNNTAAANTTVATEADLEIQKDGNFETGNPSTTIIYTVTIINHGPSDAQNVTVIDTLPDPQKKVIFVFETSNGPCAYVESTHTVECDFGTLAAGASVSFDIHIQTKGNLGTITNTATVSSTTTDPDLSNNTASKDMLVQGGSDKPGGPGGGRGGRGGGPP
jgi:uncharacterized repeat protein (TIGR01451 family)